MRQGRKSEAQTKAPVKDRIKGSSVNKKGSASSTARASSILLSDEITSALSKKAQDFNEKYKGKKVSVTTLKAVFRRGAGAFSTSHRPNMTRNGWAYARVNKFLEKKAGKPVKAAYVQDDDLMEKGGKLFNDKELLSKWKKGESIGFTGEAHLKAKGLIPRADATKRKSDKYMENGGEIGQEVICHNCGWHWNTNESEEYDKYVCHKCGFDNTLFYSNDFMAKGGSTKTNKPAWTVVGIYPDEANNWRSESEDLTKEGLLGYRIRYNKEPNYGFGYTRYNPDELELAQKDAEQYNIKSEEDKQLKKARDAENKIKREKQK